MHDIKWIRDNAAAFDAGLNRRGLQAQSATLLALDDKRRASVAAAQAAQTERNALSKEIGQAMAAKDMARAEAIKAKVAAIKEALPGYEQDEKAAGLALDDALARIPNLPAEDVPNGADEHANVEIRQFGKAPKHDFAPKEHFEIGEGLGQMDFEAAARLSGSRFVVLNRGIARLSRALGQFFLDTHTAPESEGGHGYAEVNPPVLVRDDAVFGVGQLPKFEEDLFRTTNGFWLTSTAEVTLTNLVREAILEEAYLPRRYTALTHCFRSEAGAAGRDTRGMLRQHQFEKVELVSITRPEDSKAEHERMTQCAENVLKKLGLHFRTMVLCTGDMGFSSQKTYDIEVWLPGQKTFREISSCSNCGEFQARRMNARYRPAGGGSPRFLHTLNGSGVAVGRALIAVIENYQNPDGSITVPDALLPYMAGMKRIEKAD